MRTIAEGQESKALERDVDSLARLWEKIKHDGDVLPSPSLVYRDMGMTVSMIRDLFSAEVSRLVIDSGPEYKEIVDYLSEVAPRFKERVFYHKDTTPIFDKYNIEKEIDTLQERKVFLKNGIYLVIDHTEAMVTIDINTGRFMGRKEQEQTIYKANLLAAKEVARQLRLRDIGGIIVVDFIDMDRHEYRQRLFDEFRKYLKRDRSKTSCSSVSEFGLVEMTRERERPSYMQNATEACPTCLGSGRVLSAFTMVTKIDRWIGRSRASLKESDFLLVTHPRVTSALIEEGGSRLEAMRTKYRVKLQLRSDPTINIDEYRFISMGSKEDLTSRFNT